MQRHAILALVCILSVDAKNANLDKKGKMQRETPQASPEKDFCCCKAGECTDHVKGWHGPLYEKTGRQWRFQGDKTDGCCSYQTECVAGEDHDTTDTWCQPPADKDQMHEELRVVHWNVAGPQENPFEFWMKPKENYADSKEDKVAAGVTMVQQSVATFLDSHKSVGETMGRIVEEGSLMSLLFKEFDTKTAAAEEPAWAGMANWTGADWTPPDEATAYKTAKERVFSDSAVRYLTARYQNVSKMTVKQFFEDDCIGQSRIISLPDRVFGTLKKKMAAALQKMAKENESVNVGDAPAVVRPTVISCTKEKLNDIDVWSKSWLNFIFRADHEKCTKNGKTGVYQYFPGKEKFDPKYKDNAKTGCGSLDQFNMNNKFPVPMAIMYLYIFDALLLKGAKEAEKSIHGLQVDDIRRSMCEALLDEKATKTKNVIERYMEGEHQADVLTLVEVGASLPVINPSLITQYGVIKPTKMGPQNSIVYYKHSRFTLTDDSPDMPLLLPCIRQEVIKNGKTTFVWKWEGHSCTEDKTDPEKIPTYDLRELSFAKVKDTVTGKTFMLGAYHAQSDGKESGDVVKAWIERESPTPILMGMDANTMNDEYYIALPKTKNLRLSSFKKAIATKGAMIASEGLSREDTVTTRKARSIVQAQPTKKVNYDDMISVDWDIELKDWHTKDHIVFTKSAWNVVPESFRQHNHVDPKLLFERDAFMPSFQFPSDHALIEVVLTPAATAKELSVQEKNTEEEEK